MALLEPARSAVGSGSLRVFMPEPDLYFVGRALGWRQFRCFDTCWIPGPGTPAFRRLMLDTDVAIFRGEPDLSIRAVLDQLGFHFRTVILPGGGHRSSLFGLTYGPPTYGPYFIYTVR